MHWIFQHYYIAGYTLAWFISTLCIFFLTPIEESENEEGGLILMSAVFSLFWPIVCIVGIIFLLLAARKKFQAWLTECRHAWIIDEDAKVQLDSIAMVCIKCKKKERI